MSDHENEENTTESIPELVHICEKGGYKYQNEPCPACAAERKKDIEENGFIITDADICPEQWRKWEGYVFFCKKCDSFEIFHYMKYCPMCATPIRFESDIVTAHMRKHG